MKQLKDWNPTSWDSRSNYFDMSDGSYDNWYVAPVILTRDASILEQSNWQAACDILKADKLKTVQIHNFGHWACGHYDLILINPRNKKAIEQGEDMERALADYPLLDEDDFYRRESEACDAAWQDWGLKELNELILEHLGLDYHNEITVKSWDLLSVLESQESLMQCEGNDGPCFQKSTAKHRLEQLPENEIWKYIEAIEMNAEEFDSLPHAVYHLIHLNNIKCTNIENNEALSVPDFIAVQYNENQLKLIA